MKKTVLVFGLISGGVASLLMLATVPFVDRIGFDKGVYVGYTAMVLSFMFIFFGIRSYRENIGNGEISFGRAFSVGILITVISCLCYVVTWEIVYSKLMPDFMEKYTNYVVEQAKASGVPAQEIEQKRAEMKQFVELYANPFYRAAITFFAEPFPVGVILTTISAAILRKKPKVFDAEQQLVSS